MYYTSCFAGGENLAANTRNIVNATGAFLRETEPDFIIAVGAVGNQVVNVHTTRGFLQCTGFSNDRGPGYDYKDYFNLLRKYARADATQRTLYTEEQQQEILKCVTPFAAIPTDPEGISRYPQVMYPRTKTFRIFPLDSDVMVISDVVLKRHIREQKPFIVQDKKAVFIYEDTIPVEVQVYPKVGTTTALVPMTSLRAPLQRFERITTSMKFKDFIESFMVVSPFPFQFTYIKSLTLINDDTGVLTEPQEQSITFQNVFMMRTEKNEQIIASIIFTAPDQSSMYVNSCAYSIKLGTGKIVDALKTPSVHLPFRYGQRISHNDFLNALVNYFSDETVNKEFNVSIPVLLRKDIIMKHVLTKEDAALVSSKQEVAVQQEEKKSGQRESQAVSKVVEAGDASEVAKVQVPQAEKVVAPKKVKKLVSKKKKFKKTKTKKARKKKQSKKKVVKKKKLAKKKSKKEKIMRVRY